MLKSKRFVYLYFRKWKSNFAFLLKGVIVEEIYVRDEIVTYIY